LPILLPLLLFFMLRKPPVVDTDPLGKLPLLFLLAAMTSLSVRVVHAVLVRPYNCFTRLFSARLRLDSLFGVPLFYWYRFHSDRFGSLVNYFTSASESFRGRSRNPRAVKIGRDIDSNFYQGRLTSEGVPL
jgi:hypothetical protein